MTAYEVVLTNTRTGAAYHLGWGAKRTRSHVWPFLLNWDLLTFTGQPDWDWHGGHEAWIAGEWEVTASRRTQAKALREGNLAGPRIPHQEVPPDA